tara:strand:+ start:92 stop:340 length:249 start_codon:yes stop_codon:yes gene_type:complete
MSNENKPLWKKSLYTKPIPELHKEYLEEIDALKKSAAKAKKLEARVKELEQKINWWAYNLPILECKEAINEMLRETGEGDDE